MTRPAAITTLIAALLCFFLSGCAGSRLIDQPPFITLNNLHVEDEQVILDLGIRNVSPVELELQSIEFALSLDDTSLAVYNASSAAVISASGTENLRFEIPASRDGLDLLEALGSGARNNLAYRVEGEITVQDDLPLEISRNGYLYRVPGRPGHFR
ncbi:MAG: LEA type 2 family protein [Xanthomonadales bacterium]|nr:LEA type 2 family protein [Xanthomonadales bacterium]